MNRNIISSKLYFDLQFPNPGQWGPSAIVIYDRIFLKNKECRKWIEKFPGRYGVKSGEKLKNIDFLSGHLKKILNVVEGCPSKEIVIVALGGGSVGDFAGFVASILKRGVSLVHIPSTWLAAIDSSHGGKTALNVSRVKNQVGTFYGAKEIRLVKRILTTQPNERVFEAFGEVVKIALIHGGKLWHRLENQSKISSDLYWKLLPEMIGAKYKIVCIDPFESKGHRQILNFGHTVGHVLESQLKLAHGVAVLYGVAFALEWSLQRKILTSKDYYRVRLSEIGSLIPDRPALRQLLKKLKRPERLLQYDKKISKIGRVRFVFIRGLGDIKCQHVSVEEVVNEIHRQVL